VVNNKWEYDFNNIQIVQQHGCKILWQCIKDSRLFISQGGGILDCASTSITIEFNGANQTIINPNG